MQLQLQRAEDGYHQLELKYHQQGELLQQEQSSRPPIEVMPRNESPFFRTQHKQNNARDTVDLEQSPATALNDTLLQQRNLAKTWFNQAVPIQQATAASANVVPPHGGEVKNRTTSERERLEYQQIIQGQQERLAKLENQI